MSDFYVYERRQRRTALVLLGNMAFLLTMYFAAKHFLEPSKATEQLFFWANIVLPIVEVGLFLVAVRFWRQNDTLRIAVDANRFEIVDPLSKDASFSVPVNDIVKIEHTYSKHVGFNSIMMYLKDGERFRISTNYACSRPKLYAALAKANPAIQLPKNAWRFKQA
ncbi:hypothetical protein FF011L_27350 [Roseimaritima multifibrata]|uniref:Uncharacterized protein n=1 Tax=Roseimaritima multifibrata TaxID=1930274 RepID=A0A517MGE8_9BACT|nr:hypothetical protein [Roseimaritima multifibrata]QDS93958.1 hypothetical protein FF011L_27350 [Roseimaritima multifibrata]